MPQGSVLGSVLFVLYINDLPSVISTKCKIFADDTKLYHPILSIVDQDLIQDNLDKLLHWSEEWLLGFNKEKCKVLHVGKKNPCYNYTYITKESVLVLYVICQITAGILCTSLVPFLEKDKDILENIQRRATKLVQELSKLLYITVEPNEAS